MSKCLHCEKETSDYKNYCNWNCAVDMCKKEGGKVYTPNNLPIKCIKHDGSMYEHEHGDHKDYKFPVEIEFVGQKPTLPAWDDSYCNQPHALIYSDDCIALTMYEYCYTTWYLKNGSCQGSTFYPVKNSGFWRLTVDSINKIKGSNK